jgi:hypothetical protein
VSRQSESEQAEQLLNAIGHWRARSAAFQTEMAAIEDLTPIYDDNGKFVAYEIPPDRKDAVNARVWDLFAAYLSPGDPRFEPEILGVPYVAVPA